jgi:short-subunit dehydrogenase
LCPGATSTEFEATAKAQNTRLFHWLKPMEAREVARAGFEGMQRGSGVVVPGGLNKLIALSTELLPSALTLEINRFLLHERS